MRILVVEDEIITALDLSNIIAELGHEVVGRASDYENALYLAKVELPEMVLVDVSLKGMKDGIQLAQSLREDFDLKIIFVTAFSDGDTIRRAKAYEPDGYIVKPFTKEDVFAAVELTSVGNTSPQGSRLDSEYAGTKHNAPTGLPPQVLKTVLGYIEKHFNRDLPLSELADLVGLNKDYFSTQFKRSLGTSPYRYIVHQRLEEAKRLLRNTELSIDQVANMVGYSNQAHFSAAFRKAFEVTPTEYRRA